MSKSSQNKPLTPENYIRTRARLLPLGPCFINQEWENSGMAFIIVSRKHINGNLTFGIFQVDLHCLGVKEALWVFNEHPLELEDIKKKQEEMLGGEDPLIPVDYVVAHNVIYGSIEFAEEFGFRPCKEFSLTRFILEEDDEKVELMDIEFGVDGKPAIYFGHESHPKNIIAQLVKNPGPGNFVIVYPEDGEPGDESEAFFDDEEEDDEEGMDQEIIDKPLEEMTESDMSDFLEGRKNLSVKNLFLFMFAAIKTTFKKKEDKEIDRILDELDKWNISDESDDPTDYSLNETASKLYDELYGMIETDPEAALPSIKEAIAQSGGNLNFYDLLGFCYEALEEEELMNDLAGEIYRRFPRQVMSVTNYINRLLVAGKMEEAKKLIDLSFDIHRQFPERTSFSALELLSYMLALIHFQTEQGKIIPAIAYTYFLTNFEWSGHAENTANDIYNSTAMKISEYLFEIRKNSVNN